MKFQLFDSQHKFYPSVLIYAVEISSDDGYLEHHYFWFRKSAEKFFKENREKITSGFHICMGGEPLWFN